MLVPDNIYQNIEDIIERSYTGFIMDIVGDEFLSPEQRLQAEALGLLTNRKTLLELVYLMVKQRSEERYQTRRDLNELLEEIFATGVFDRLPETHQATIDNALQSMETIIQDAKAEVKVRVKKEIIKANKEFTRAQPLNIPLVPTEAEQEKKESGKAKKIGMLMAAVGATLLAVNKNFQRDFTSELTDFVNAAAADTAKEAAGKDAMVYKLVVNDTHLCDYCHKSYVNPDGTPKLYKLKDLQKNGTNEGKPKSSWKPVVGPHHPRCRCQLLFASKKVLD